MAQPPMEEKEENKGSRWSDLLPSSPPASPPSPPPPTTNPIPGQNAQKWPDTTTATPSLPPLSMTPPGFDPLPFRPPPLPPPSLAPPQPLQLALLDLNTAPRLVPKLEPLLDEDDQDELPSPSPSSGSSAGAPCFADDEPAPLRRISSNSKEDDLFSEYYRLAHLFLSSVATGDSAATAAACPAAISAPAETVAASADWSIVPAQTDGVSPSVVVAAKKRRKYTPRSAEMVRVSGMAEIDHRRFRDLVRRTRATYESLRILFSRDEEKLAGMLLSSSLLSPPGRRSRADLRAATLLRESNFWLNRDKRIIGSIPGISVGDIFFYRMELCVVGLHGQTQGGIDYVPASRSTSGEPIATSIVVSGGYEDDEDSGNVIVYTGHGGRDHNLHKQSVDQKLEGGNLGLERSLNYGIEIRVVRGFQFEASPSGRIYVYDGLYRVVSYWQAVGKSGFSVYKFKLVRVAGQDEMGSIVLKNAQDLKEKLLTTKPAGYLTHDISMGKEKKPVALFNDIDDDTDPMLFEYLTHPVYPSSILLHGPNGSRIGGCQCDTNCSDSCSCAAMNGGKFPYDDNGILLMGKPLIYECGSFCRCPPSCRNRVSQKGVRNRLEVFRSRETGWGVRSLDLIRAGAFVCEFSGIVLTGQQTEVLSTNGDGLVYANRFPHHWYEWGDISHVIPECVRPWYPLLPQLSFSVDVSRSRNVACYLSHSYSPNVFLQLVLYDHYDMSYPHLMIFAMENIPPLRELSIDYGVGDALVSVPIDEKVLQT